MNTMNAMKTELNYEEIELRAKNGMGMLILFICLYLAGVAAAIVGGIMLDDAAVAAGVVLLVAGSVYCCLGWIPFMGLRYSSPERRWYSPFSAGISVR
jgi:hypothetical protein